MMAPARIAAWTSELTGVRRAITAVLLGALSLLAFAPFHLWPALFVSLGGLTWLLDGSYRAGRTLFVRVSGAAITGFWFGFGFFLTGLYWVAEAFLVEPWRHGWLIPFVMTALPASMALFFAAGSAITMVLWRPGPARVFALGVGLGLSELARGHVLTGFPWNLIGYGLLANDALMQLAAPFGVYAVTVFAVLLFSAPAAICSDGEPQSRATVLLTALLVGVLGASFFWGSARLSGAYDTPSDIRLRLVQANISQAEKWQPDNAKRIFETYLEMTQRPGIEEINIVVWPETALPFPLDKSEDALAAIGAALPSKTILLVGSVRWAEKRNDKGILLSREAFNSLMAVNAAGDVFTVFDKIHLVPFGEFLPYQNFLESLGVMQMTGVRGGFNAGAGPRLLTVPGAPPALPLICYEIIFPEEVRPSRSSQADTDRPGWMLNVTNDAWFGSSAGPYQHFFQARVRAAELGLPLVRVANTGISALIDPWGRVVAEIPLDAENILDISLPNSGPPTLYYSFGSWADLLAVIAALLGWFACAISTRRPSLTG